MTRESPSDQNQSGKPEPKTSMGGNQQVPQAAGNPRFRNPGLDPSPDPKIVVKAINPPVTPDQIVGMAEMPSAATLDLPKIQNIKIPPVKNKTIQGHLKAIEAKMTATEKLMKDVVKLQKLQIITEKELFERKRELYQNTFEEYLLDKTVDFENPDDDGGIANAIKKGPGGGFPFFGGRRRRKGRGPKGGGGAGAAATAGAATTAAERMATGQSSGLSNLGIDYKKQEQDAIKKADEFRRQQEQKTKVRPKGTPAPDQDEAEAVPETPAVPEPAPLRRIPTRFPILDPKRAQPFIIPDVISQRGTEATPPVVTIPGFDMRVKTHQQELAHAIETYIENNPGSEFEIKLGRGARTDTGHLIKREDGKLYIHEPLTQEQLILIGAGNVLNPAGWMPIVPKVRTGRRAGSGSVPMLPTLNPARRAPTASPGTNTINPGPSRTQQPAQPLSPVTARGARLGGTKQIMKQSKPVNPKEAQMQVNRDIMEAEMLGQDPRFVKMLMDQGFNFSAGSNVMPRTKKIFQSKRQPGVSFETNMDISDFLGAGGGFGQRPLSTKEILQQMKQSSFDQYSSPIGPMPKASGGIGDIDLYSSKSLNYFRGMSSKIMPMADGGFMGWFNRGANTRIPNEAKASWRQLFADDLSQRQHITADPKSAWNPVRGMPGYGSAKSVINPRIRAINTRRRSMGKPPLSMDKINPGGFQTGPTPIQRELIKRPVRAMRSNIQHPVMLALDFIINDLLLNPPSTAVYDQVTGPNAYYNDPAYKGPMPSQNLENAQSSMMSGNDPKVEVKPLPPEYIKIPGKKKAPDFVGTESPDIQMRSSIFSRSSTHID